MTRLEATNEGRNYLRVNKCCCADCARCGAVFNNSHRCNDGITGELHTTVSNEIRSCNCFVPTVEYAARLAVERMEYMGEGNLPPMCKDALHTLHKAFDLKKRYEEADKKEGETGEGV